MNCICCARPPAAGQTQPNRHRHRAAHDTQPRLVGHTRRRRYARTRVRRAAPQRGTHGSARLSALQMSAESFRACNRLCLLAAVRRSVHEHQVEARRGAAPERVKQCQTKRVPIVPHAAHVVPPVLQQRAVPNHRLTLPSGRAHAAHRRSCAVASLRVRCQPRPCAGSPGRGGGLSAAVCTHMRRGSAREGVSGTERPAANRTAGPHVALNGMSCESARLKSITTYSCHATVMCTMSARRFGGCKRAILQPCRRRERVYFRRSSRGGPRRRAP